MSKRATSVVGAVVGALVGMFAARYTALSGYWPMLLSAACAGLGAHLGDRFGR